MTPKAILFDSQTAALLRPWRESGEKIILPEFTDSAPDWGAPEDHFIAEPEEIEVLNYEDVRDKFGFNPAGQFRGSRQT